MYNYIHILYNILHHIHQDIDIYNHLMGLEIRHSYILHNLIHIRLHHISN